MSMNNGVMKMRPLADGLTLPPGKSITLAPGGYHIMLMGLTAPLKSGEKVPVTLTFEKAGEAKVTFDVQGIGAMSPASGQSDHNAMPGMKSDHKM
jgi:periplasmic copper chaperone A